MRVERFASRARVPTSAGSRLRRDDASLQTTRLPHFHRRACDSDQGAKEQHLSLEARWSVNVRAVEERHLLVHLGSSTIYVERVS